MNGSHRRVFGLMTVLVLGGVLAVAQGQEGRPPSKLGGEPPRRPADGTDAGTADPAARAGR
jgi:hypothetical protein